MSQIITCPSGLTGAVRKMKVSEARTFSTDKKNTYGDPISRLNKACWEETIDPGPYQLTDSGIDWNKVLFGDRLQGMIGIRSVTFGPQYFFSANCQEPDCRKRIDWELDLNEIPVRPLTEENKELFINGNRFETVLPESGAKLWFRMLIGEDDAKLARLRQKNGELDLGDLLNFRIVEIEGVDSRDKRKFIDDLTLGDADFLVDEFYRTDCGLDTSIEIECPTCGVTQEIELPFGPTFFMPGNRRRTKREFSMHQDRGSY